MNPHELTQSSPLEALAHNISTALRIVASVTILVTATLLVLGLSWIPIKIRGVKLSAWPFSLGVRLLLPALGLHFRCKDPEKLFQHRGVVFPNHLSYVDTLVMAYLLPMRFVAKAETKKMPFVGQIATATGTMYVDRGDKNSRGQVRQMLARQIAADPYPPVVVYPEGTTNPAPGLLPFRYGAFEIAVQEQIPYMLCAIVYERPDLVTWQTREEGVMGTLMRIVRSPGSTVELVPLQVIQPQADDDHQRLANEAREIILEALRDTPMP